MITGIKPTESCITCHRCDTLGFRFSSVLMTLRCPALYAAGSTIFVEGQRPTGVYVVCQGGVNVTMTSRRGKTAVLRSCAQGDLIGIADVFCNQDVVTRATAVRSSEVAHIPAAQFRHAIWGNCEALAAIGRLLASELRQQYLRTTSIYLNPSGRGRFIDWLRQIGATGRQTRRGVVIPFPYTQQQLAEHLGCTRETVARLLLNFSRQGAIERRGAMLILARDFNRKLGVGEPSWKGARLHRSVLQLPDHSAQ